MIWWPTSAGADEVVVVDGIYTITPLVCAVACDQGSFCGRDLTCHPHSCENWYTFGHPAMTKYNNNTAQKDAAAVATQLDCQIMTANGQDRSFLTEGQVCKDGNLPSALSFHNGCDYDGGDCVYDDSSSLSSGRPPVPRMNRKCTAAPIDGYGFVCYDMAPETDFDTYFAEYMTATANVEVGT